MQLFLIIYF